MLTKSVGLRWLTILASFLLLCGCEEASKNGEDLPSGGVKDEVAVLADGSTYFLWNAPGEYDSPAELWHTSVGEKATRLADVSTTDCDHPYLSHLAPLPDGRLGAVASCPEGVNGDEYIAIRVASSGTRVELLARIPDHTTLIWRPGFVEGWVVYDYRGCGGFAEFSAKSSVQPLPPIESSEISWKLDGDLVGNDRENCSSRGEVAFPVFSAKAGMLYFLASPGSIGTPGNVRYTRHDLAWNLYRYDVAQQKITIVALNFLNPAGIAVSDGKSDIFVSGAYGSIQGIWRVNPDNGAVTNVDRGMLGMPRLSPDGHQLVAVRYSGPDLYQGKPSLVVRQS